MNTLAMKKFGRVLTDREYGRASAKKIIATESFPLTLDFQGVVALGSSFGDEVVHAVAKKQNLHLRVQNAATAVRQCLGLIAEDFNIQIEYIEKH